MHSVLAGQFDYLLLIYGLLAVRLGMRAAEAAQRGTAGLPWSWLAAFGWLQGLATWWEILALGGNTGVAHAAIRGVLWAGAFLALAEFGRRGAVGRRSLGRWIYLLPLAVLGWWTYRYAAGWTAACGFLLGLPAGCACTVALWQAGRRQESTHRLALRGLAASVGGLAILVGMVGTRAVCVPAGLVIERAFLACAGFLFATLQAACVVVAILALRKLQRVPARTVRAAFPRGGVAADACAEQLPCGDDKPVARPTIVRRPVRGWILGAAVALVLLGGWVIAQWRAGETRAELHDELLSQAQTIAGSLDLEQVETLSFSRADLDQPAYYRSCRQLECCGRSLQDAGLFLFAARGGVVRVGPTCRPAGDPAATPGTALADAGPEEWNCLRQAQACVKGPLAGAAGPFVRVLSPVRERRTGNVLLAVGIDVRTAPWSNCVQQQRLPAVLWTLAVILILLASEHLQRRRAAVPEAQQRWLRHASTAATAVGGLVLSLFAAWLADLFEASARHLTFAHAAQSQAVSVGETMRKIRDNQLASLARFLEHRVHPTREEFREFARPLLRTPAVAAYKWIPAVPMNEKAEYEAAARQDGRRGFTIFELDAAGRRVLAGGRTVYYPVDYLEPLDGAGAAIGFDLGADPVRRATLVETAQMRMVTGSPRLALSSAPSRHGLLVCCPVTGKPAGGAAATCGDLPRRR